MLEYVRLVIATKVDSERGASAVEYGLLVAAIAAVIVALVFGLGKLLSSSFSKTSNCISTNGSGC